MKHSRPFFNANKAENKEADIRIKIKTVNEKIENQRIERLQKKPPSIEEQIISGNLTKK